MLLGFIEAATLVAIYVTSLYAYAPTLGLSRSDPLTIKARTCGVILVTLCALLFLTYRRGTISFDLTSLLGDGLASFFLGSWWSFVLFFGVFADCLLFPILLGQVVRAQQTYQSAFKSLLPVWSGGSLVNWTALRDVVIAPISEEVVFRAAVLELLVRPLPFFESSDSSELAPASPPPELRLAIFISCCLFGFAHAHHHLDVGRLLARRAPRIPPGDSTTQSVWAAADSAADTRADRRGGLNRFLAHFAMTFVFGWIAAVIFLRSGLFGAIGAHAFANALGPPPFGFMRATSLAQRDRFAVHHRHVGRRGAIASLEHSLLSFTASLPVALRVLTSFICNVIGVGGFCCVAMGIFF